MKTLPIAVSLLLAVTSAEGQRLTVTSPAFANGGTIPPKFTCDGADVIPPLDLGAVPAGAKSLAIVMDDPDAPRGTWVHWVVWNLPPETRHIAEGKVPEGVTGRNSWARNAWGGPCPPGGVHRYFFRVYALDRVLQLPPSAGKAELENAMRGHVLASGELMGRYARK